MPWLAGTALIHSLGQSPRDAAHSRAGRCCSRSARSAELLGHVPGPLGRADLGHAFATDPARGMFILGVPGRCDRRVADAVRVAAPTRRRGRATVVLGRVARWLPARQQRAAGGRCGRGVARHALSTDRWTRLAWARFSVGPPYFETVFFPLMAPAMFLMGVGPMARWREGPGARPASAVALGAGRGIGHRRLSFASSPARAASGSSSAWPSAPGSIVATAVALIERLRDAGGQGHWPGHPARGAPRPASGECSSLTSESGSSSSAWLA